MNEIATPQEFSDICPFSDAQFKEKMKELVAEDGFKHAVTWVMPDIDFDGFCKMLLQINTKKEFQENVMFDFLKLLAAKTTEGISYDNIEKVDQNKSYTMMTNHRDIVLDASFLNLALLYNHYRTTEVAIGSNLLIYKWIEDRLSALPNSCRATSTSPSRKSMSRFGLHNAKDAPKTAATPLRKASSRCSQSRVENRLSTISLN